MVGCLTQGISNPATKFGETPAFRRSIQCRPVKWDTLLALAEQEKCLYASARLAGVTLACSLGFQCQLEVFGGVFVYGIAVIRLFVSLF
jgi:hypothetical protein